MPERHTLIVEVPTRLDQLLARSWDALDRAQIQDMVTQGAVDINGQTALKPGQRLEPGDEVQVLLPDLAPVEAPEPPPGLEFTVAYEDDHLLIVDKPAGLPVRRPRQPDAASLPRLLAERYPDMAHVGGVNRAGVVTTLGEDVSGLVLAGKDEATYREMRRAVTHHEVTEQYSALVEGHAQGEFTIEQPLGNAKHVRGRVIVAREGRPAITHVREQQHYKESGQDYTLVLLQPETSRMHQMRVHLAWYGYPLVGDRRYGSRRQTLLMDRIFLHLSVIALRHPDTGESMRVESELPPELRSILAYMRRPKF